MNEGCDGGWAFFNGYLAERGYLVSEECAPYKAKTKGLQCSDSSNCSAIAKVNKAYFVGGAYGNTTEKNMMQEILMNGPVNGEL